MNDTALRTPETTSTAGLFALLADPLRLRIVELLAAEQLCTCHLVELTGARQTTVSHHLRQLRQAGLVRPLPDGRYTWYRFEPAALEPLGDLLAALTTGDQHRDRRRVPCIQDAAAPGGDR